MRVYILHFILQACVKLYTRVHAWSDAMRVFAFAHVCDMRGMFKLWVTCTVVMERTSGLNIRNEWSSISSYST